MTALSIVDAMDDPQLFEPWFRGESWNGWRTILKGAYALPMTEAEREFFRLVAEREPPAEPVTELWIVAGRRAGKDSIASVIVAHSAALFDQQHRLRPGETALVMCLAVDRPQAGIVLNYSRSYFTDIDLLKELIKRETANGFELGNGVEVAVATNSFRSVRGRTILCVVMDETAFWRDETSASPDEETYRALKPGLSTLPGSMLVGISSPYKKSGLLYRRYKEHYGKNSNVLVVKAPTTLLNPTIDQAIIDEALEEDPAAARAEWLAEFRDDIAAYVTPEVVDAAIIIDVHERAPIDGVKYFGFCDPSGGASDSMTLGISHLEGRTLVLDLAHERPAPFEPTAVVGEFSDLLKRYRLSIVRGDRYAGEWPREAFSHHGITYRASDLTKSEIYLNALPELNSKRVELLDIKRLAVQIKGLERRTARGGKENIDHAPAAKDDLANAALGALLLAKPASAFNQIDIGVGAIQVGHASEFADEANDGFGCAADGFGYAHLTRPGW